MAQKPKTTSTSPRRCSSPAWRGKRCASRSICLVAKVWISARPKRTAATRSIGVGCMHGPPRVAARPSREPVACTALGDTRCESTRRPARPCGRSASTASITARLVSSRASASARRSMSSAASSPSSAPSSTIGRSAGARSSRSKYGVQASASSATAWRKPMHQSSASTSSRPSTSAMLNTGSQASGASRSWHAMPCRWRSTSTVAFLRCRLLSNGALPSPSPPHTAGIHARVRRWSTSRGPTSSAVR